MKLNEVIKLTDGKILCGDKNLNVDLTQAFSSDLMSDVLTLGMTDILSNMNSDIKFKQNDKG